MTSASLDSLLLWDGSGRESHLLAFTQESSVKAALLSLLSAIGSDPLWERLSGARLVTRSHPVPLIAAFGHFSSFERARLHNLATLLTEALDNHRYVDYIEAERLSECLAEALVQRFSREALRGFRFAAIPRGGHIVLGMLAYALDLDPWQLCDIDSALSEGQAAPVVIVDDCAISGIRLQQHLRAAKEQDVVFASLLAPDGFRPALMAREKSVLDCLSAETLEDLGPRRYGEGYAEWQREREFLSQGQGVWVGVVSYFAFAWSEPQSKYWNADVQRFEPGWRLQPARHCLAHRHRHSASWPLERISCCDAIHEWLRLAERVLWVDIQGQVAVAMMPLAGEADASCFRLEGSAAAMWHAAMTCGSPDAAVTTLQRRYAIDRRVLQGDLQEFVSALKARGLVVNEI
jgi:hypothetical protein